MAIRLTTNKLIICRSLPKNSLSNRTKIRKTTLPFRRILFKRIKLISSYKAISMIRKMAVKKKRSMKRRKIEVHLRPSVRTVTLPFTVRRVNDLNIPINHFIHLTSTLHIGHQHHIDITS